MWRNGLLVLLSLALCQLCFVAEGFRIPRQLAEDKEACGYKSCPVVQPNKLNIHLVAHTHDDVGWLKTVDQYYFGSRSMIQKAGVQYILDSVIEALLKHPERRFIYVETAFFWKWWLRQKEDVRNDVRMLIESGRLEIIGGAWSMNDEAVTHYHSIVDQFTWGFRRLNDTFGSCARPRIGWQIDPFGHSREQASLFAQMGFDGMLFGRMDYQDKSKRLKDKTMEFVWKASPSLGDRANLFTAAMFNTYSPPPGFCFDVLCADEPVIDDPDSPDYNVDAKVELFLAYAQIQARSYRTNNIIVTMGDDFHYQQADMWFTNLDKLIKYGNERNGSTVNLFYSTPSCYLKSLNDAGLTWPTKSDDFFPYASDPHAFWTGYFTSRPTIKFFERMGNNILQVSKQLAVLANLKDNQKQLELFREVMGVMQHHDAVTGTEKQLVANDYARMLYESVFNGENIAAKSLNKWTVKSDDARSNFDTYSCLQLNISSCTYTEDNEQFIVQVYNPLSRFVNTYVRLPVDGNSYDVWDITDNVKVITQVVPVPEQVLQVPGRDSKAAKEVVFRANDLPPLGYKSYRVIGKPDTPVESFVEATDSIGGELYTITVNEDGNIAVQYNKQKDMNFVQSFDYYEGAEGNNIGFANRSSGAYIFRPKDSIIHKLVNERKYSIVKGPLVEEIHQKINDWVSQVVRVYAGEERIEFEWLVGPIPVDDKIGKEIVTKYSSNLNSGSEFYTDTNGRETLKRKRDYRPTWDLDLHEPIAGNYYPVTTKIYLKDQEKPLKLSVLTDRAQGGTSMQDGQLELMLHRRLLRDDAFGVAEALNESAFGKGLVARGVHYVLGGSTKNLDAFALHEKELTLQLALRPSIYVTPVTETNVEHWRNVHLSKRSGFTKELPRNVHVLTLEPWKDGTVLLRLEHVFEVGEAIQLSQPVEVNIKDLFTSFTIKSIKETTLGANQWIEDNHRLQWEPETNEILRKPQQGLEPITVQDDVINVLLKPMEIRTFIVEELYEQDETWAQTILTITPEDDAVLREIKPLVTVSAPDRDSFELHTDSYIYRRPLTPKYLVDPEELEDENIRHIETQTYLQGIPIVDIPVRYKDEVSQTLYMSTPCPPIKYYKDVMTSMRDGPVPEMRNTRQTQTILTFNPNVTHQVATEQLMIDITNEEDIKDVAFLWDEEDYLQTELDALILDVLYYVKKRAFWIVDPSSLSYPSIIENYVQTLIKYNQLTNSIVVDNETQTGLTCEPKRSNTELLIDYQASKNLVTDILDECFDKAIESRELVNDIINEIVDKCVERVRYPPKDQDIQTLASYKTDENKENVLRKLQLPVVVDPLEGSIVVIPLIDHLLETICKIVYENAKQATAGILQTAVERSVYIGSKIDEIRNKSYGKPIEEILDQRRRKIAKLMTKKKTETVFTQTSISGINEVTKLETPKEIYSCFCLKDSRCNVCLSMKTDKSLVREMKMMRTQDILLAYKPCQVVGSPSKIDRVSLKNIEDRSATLRTPSSGDSSSDSTATLEVVFLSLNRFH